jgi:hypothetical protein
MIWQEIPLGFSIDGADLMKVMINHSSIRVSEVGRMRKLSLRDEYRTEITGLGEVYEVISCRLIMRHLRAQFPGDYVVTFLSRKDDSELLRSISKKSTVVATGFADIPPWKSGHRPLKQTSGVSPLLRFSSFAKPVLRLLASLEQWYPYAVKVRKAHIAWLLRSS